MAELLSPAGGREALVAAVQNGADAVYMGFGAFNARHNARNFSDEEFRGAVRYCHARGVKVYLTLNTLVTDRELDALIETARKASAYGVDAILVQDWGVLDALRRCVPDVPIHASTQMSLHTLSGVRQAAALGCTRAVLARELSREDVREIQESAPIEIETFAHGALCMCYSGQCEMSAVIGGRSGNRGRCAQPCRLPYGWDGKADGYPLSLKDANLASRVCEMDELGIACLKLEGRMKRPEYVAAITGIYASLLREHRAPKADEQKKLALAFSRDGFTDGYWTGTRGQKMFGTRPEDARWPEEWFTELRAAYEKEDLRTIPVKFSCTVRAGEPMTLTADDGTHRVSVCGSIPESARSRAVTAEEAEARLRKTGGTPFRVSHCEMTVEDGLAVSAAALNALRRDALCALEEARCAVPPRRSLPFPPVEAVKNNPAPPLLTVSLMRPEQLTDALIDEAPTLVYLPLELAEQFPIEKYVGRTRFCVVLPRIYRTQDEPLFREWLLRAKARGADAVSVGNLGHFPLVEGAGLEVRGDFGLNVFNSAALRLLRSLGLDTATLSFELRSEQLRDVQKCIPCEAIVYGRLPLMITENCIVANRFGCKHFQTHDGEAGDGACADGHCLTDRRGERFPVLRAYGCRSEIENGKTLWLADRDDWKSLGLSFARLRFTTESGADCARILRAYRLGTDETPDDHTRGLFTRGVE